MDRIKIEREIARAEGVMMALYGITRDLVIGCSVDKEENGKLGDVVGDVMHGLLEAYKELERSEVSCND